MDNTTLVKIGSVVVAVATAITELALVSGLVWSLVTHRPAILPVTLLFLSAGFGVFVYSDYKKFFSKKS